MKKARLPKTDETHIRGISTTLGLLDEMLCEIEQWAQGREARSALYEERNRLSSLQRKEILSEIAAMRLTLDELRSGLRLQKNFVNAANAIWSRCAGMWEHLVELQGKYLERYGEPPPGLQEYLEPRISELIERLERISAIARGKG